jgi:hypothetical protein
MPMPPSRSLLFSTLGSFLTNSRCFPRRPHWGLANLQQRSIIGGSIELRACSNAALGGAICIQCIRAHLHARCAIDLKICIRTMPPLLAPSSAGWERGREVLKVHNRNPSIRRSSKRSDEWIKKLFALIYKGAHSLFKYYFSWRIYFFHLLFFFLYFLRWCLLNFHYSILKNYNCMQFTLSFFMASIF